MDIKWIKLSVSTFDDEKIKLLESMPDFRAIQLIWIKLICHAGKTNSHGYIFLSENIPYTAAQLSMLFREPVNTIELALMTFEKLGMITRDDNGIKINNFERHQSLDKLAKKQEQQRIRVSNFRLKQKLLPRACNANVTQDVTQGNAVDNNTLHYTTQDKDNITTLISLVFTTFENDYQQLTPTTTAIINNFLDTYPHQWVKDALDIGIKNNARNLNYIQKILENWQTKGRDWQPQNKANTNKPFKSIYPELH